MQDKLTRIVITENGIAQLVQDPDAGPLYQLPDGRRVEPVIAFYYRREYAHKIAKRIKTEERFRTLCERNGVRYEDFSPQH